MSSSKNLPWGTPYYDDLPALPTGARCSWGVFGPEDQLGALNFLTKERVKEAARGIQTGQRVSLSTPLGSLVPPLAEKRLPLVHSWERGRTGSDDRLDSFFPQDSSQWDSLAHVRYRQYGFYGGRDDSELDGGALGIDAWVKHGVVGRGVLVDVLAYREHCGKSMLPNERSGIGVDEIEATLELEKVTPQPGDILIVRTGWLEWYESLNDTGREDLAGTLGREEAGLACPGLEQGDAVPRWLWNNGIAAVAADNPALEAMPPTRGVGGSIHQFLLPLLGMPIGELWEVRDLSRLCKELSRWEFFLSAQPINLPCGVGSPNNALAIF